VTRASSRAIESRNRSMVTVKQSERAPKTTSGSRLPNRGDPECNAVSGVLDLVVAHIELGERECTAVFLVPKVVFPDLGLGETTPTVPFAERTPADREWELGDILVELDVGECELEGTVLELGEAGTRGRIPRTRARVPRTRARIPRTRARGKSPQGWGAGTRARIQSRRLDEAPTRARLRRRRALGQNK
jgi:hypothetical protein